MGRQLALLVAVFAATTVAALFVGVKNLGTAFGVAQVCFAGALVWVLMRDRGRGSASPDPPRRCPPRHSPGPS